MFLTLDIPPEDVDRLLDERGRSPDAEDKRLWLLCRRHHLSKKFETDDGQFDSDGFAKTLSEAMTGDRGDKDVPNLSRHEQHYLRDDHFYDLAEIVARAADRILECCKGKKDQEDHLKSLRRLVRDLGRAIADCDSIQDYLSVSNLLFWSAKDVLDLTTDPSMPKFTGIGSLKSIVRDFFMNYVTSVLLVESKAGIPSAGLAGIELGIPSEEFDNHVKNRLELASIGIGPKRKQLGKSQLFPKSSTYLTPKGRVDIGSFSDVLAKMMVIDKQEELPLLMEVPDFESKYFIAINTINQFGRTVRYFQQLEGEWKIRDEMGASTIVERLVAIGLILPTFDRAKILSDDLISPKSMKEMTEELAVLIRDQLLTEETKIVETQPKDGEVHIRLTEVRPFIIDLGGCTTRCCKDFLTYLTASLYLFLATADAWWSLPASDSCREAREFMRSVAEKFLRNYLALVLICETKAEAQKVEELKANESEAEQPKAEGSGAGESASGDSEPVKRLPVMYDIPREPFSKPCCILF
ncbi:uncharacterized protein B0T23DRAFT_413119 [Neurospora hispaniola]|uniref:Uncharacterized protein n=1 Tax=Neurospora hispaniola TaxID=588809 RepID=A0AAJ0MPZ3_9PEZI|nr:hypothetical protein B0T23DRAFT_413119 [Neurospora hispaniola]